MIGSHGEGPRSCHGSGADYDQSLILEPNQSLVGFRKRMALYQLVDYGWVRDVAVGWLRLRLDTDNDALDML